MRLDDTICKDGGTHAWDGGAGQCIVCGQRPPESAPPKARGEAEKDPWGLVPWGAMRLVVKVLAYGAKKYPKDHHKSVSIEEHFAAAMRHLISWREGESKDGESGLPHLAHACTRILFLLAREP